VSSDCTASSKTFKGNQVCANSCKSVVGALLETAEEQQAAALLQTAEVQREEAAAMAEDEAIAEQDWSIFGTTEQCCRCKSGTVGWSKSGKCSFCKGAVAKKKSVSSDCTASSKTFKGNQVCANSCKSVVGALLQGAAETVEPVSRDSVEEDPSTLEADAIADVAGMALLSDLVVEDWSIFGTTEQCCKCKSGQMGWSASGKCSFCSGGIAKKKSVPSDCVTKGKTFKGNTVCANMCGKALR